MLRYSQNKGISSTTFSTCKVLTRVSNPSQGMRSETRTFGEDVPALEKDLPHFYTSDQRLRTRYLDQHYPLQVAAQAHSTEPGVTGVLDRDSEGTPTVADAAPTNVESVIRDEADMERLIDAEETKSPAFNNRASHAMQAEANVSASAIESSPIVTNESTSTSTPSSRAFRPVRGLPYA